VSCQRIPLEISVGNFEDTVKLVRPTDAIGVSKSVFAAREQLYLREFIRREDTESLGVALDDIDEV